MEFDVIITSTEIVTRSYLLLSAPLVEGAVVIEGTATVGDSVIAVGLFGLLLYLIVRDILDYWERR